ncbi:hypothetical protein CMV_027947, partial [Castanea mollissima]
MDIERELPLGHLDHLGMHVCNFASLS